MYYINWYLSRFNIFFQRKSICYLRRKKHYIQEQSNEKKFGVWEMTENLAGASVYTINIIGKDVRSI